MNAPSSPAVPVIEALLARFLATSALRGWVLPMRVTVLPLTTASLPGLLIVTFGLAVSRM